MSGCTVVTGGAGETCGAPAVATFVSGSGKRYFECEAHAFPAVRAEALKAERKPRLVMPATGTRYRTSTTRRYAMAIEIVEGKPVTLKRSDDRGLLEKIRRVRGGVTLTTPIFDTVTGEVF